LAVSSSGGADIGRRGQQYAAESRYGVRQDAAATCDFIGFGFGPSNLALAVAARELAPSVIGRFFEQNATFQWHPGMMFDDARMQVPFLKDLVTLRNPASPYTFLQYVKAKGRLERFVNLREFHPTRKEFEDYLAWVADAFRDQVQYAAIVERVTAITQGNESVPSIFRVQVRDADGKVTVFHTKNVVSASGGQPRLPKGCVTSRSIVHSSEFLKRFPSRFPDCAARHDFAVVGDGQSAGEITAYLLRHYANARVHLHIPSFAPRQADSSPFVNEAFFSCEVDSTFFEEQAHRGTINGELRNTNYGVMDSDLINQIYRATYLDEVRGERRLFVHRFSTFLSADDRHDRLEIVLQKAQGEVTREYCDALVLATGYEHRIDPAVFEDLLPLLKTGSSGELVLSRNYRVQTTPAMNCGLYLQGAAEASHGIGNTLLSLLPFRTKEILDDICNNSDHGENPDRTDEKTNWTRPPVSHSSRHAEYPPQRHLDTDLERLYAVIAQFMSR
jgi:lysine/ornithine N-monooxygenase